MPSTGPKPSNIRMTIYMTPEFRAFLDELRELGGYPNDAAMFDAAVKALAKAHRRTPPTRAHPVGYAGQDRPKPNGKGSTR